MTTAGIPTSAKELAAIVKNGQGPAVEFKRSTGGITGLIEIQDRP